jgi:hypothetical protein
MFETPSPAVVSSSIFLCRDVARCCVACFRVHRCFFSFFAVVSFLSSLLSLFCCRWWWWYTATVESVDQLSRLCNCVYVCVCECLVSQ